MMKHRPRFCPSGRRLFSRSLIFLFSDDRRLSETPSEERLRFKR